MPTGGDRDGAGHEGAPLAPASADSEPACADSEQSDAAPADPVETALADALTRAAAAEQWEVVQQLARELEARRTACSASNVVKLDAANKRSS